MGLYTCVIVNPSSANGATGRLWPEIRAALDRVLDRWDNQFTIGPGDGTRLAREARPVTGPDRELVVPAVQHAIERGADLRPQAAGGAVGAGRVDDDAGVKAHSARSRRLLKPG